MGQKNPWSGTLLQKVTYYCPGQTPRPIFFLFWSNFFGFRGNFTPHFLNFGPGCIAPWWTQAVRVLLTNKQEFEELTLNPTLIYIHLRSSFLHIHFNNVKSKVLTVNDRPFAMTFDAAESVFILELYLEGTMRQERILFNITYHLRRPSSRLFYPGSKKTCYGYTGYFTV